MKKPSFAIKEKMSFMFWSLLLVQLITMLVMSLDAGISADESRHIKQAQKVYNYYQSNGEDRSALENTGRDPMQFNGQSFDNLTYWIAQKLDIENFIEMRHLCNALVGWLILLISGLFAKKIWGTKAAIITVLLLFISPRFIGHALNNNKDIPFALGFILSFYATYAFLKKLPKIDIKYILLTTLGIAIAISIRLAGLLSIGFLGLFSAVYFFSKKPIWGFFKKEKLHLLKWLAIIVPGASIAGYFLGILYWPFMMEAPLKHIKTVLDATSAHPVALNQLFEGKLILSNQLPHYYSLKYMLISYPLVILAGMVLSVVLAPFRLKKDQLFAYFIITFAFVFVFVWMSYKNSNYYGGIRHLTFVYPLAVCMAVFGYSFLLDIFEKFSNRYVKLVPAILLLALSIDPVVHLIKNYPYSYIYFNPIAGGVKKAYDQYETDYFQHSLKHATEWFKENELPNIKDDSATIQIVTNDHFNTSYYLRDVADRVQTTYTRYYEKSMKNWDYAIFYCGYISPNQLTDKLWPPKGTIHTETVDGFPICAVVKRVSYDDYKGFKSLNKKQVKAAKKYFKNFLSVYPKSDEVLEGYARAMLMEHKYDSTIIYADSSLIYNHRHIGALLAKASAQNASKQYEAVIATTTQINAINDMLEESHFQKAFAFKHLNKPNDALEELQKAIQQKADYWKAYYLMGDILSNYKNYNKAIEIYSKILEKKPNDFTAQMRITRCNYLLGNTQKALEHLNNIPKNRLYRLEVVALKARMALNKKDLNTAAYQLRIARNIQNNSNLSVLRARFYLAQNNNKRAKELLNTAIEQDPTNREAQDLLKSMASKTPEQNKNAAAQNPKAKTSVMYQSPAKKKSNPLGVQQQ